MTAHAVDACARGRRRGADEESRVGRFVRRELRHWTGEELQAVVGAATNIAADVVRVVGLQLYRTRIVPSQHDVAKARRETLELGLDARSHVLGAAMRHVAVDPGRMFPGRGST